MKIGVVSDTHLKGYDERLKRIADKYFADAGLILHAGDLVDLRVLDAFSGREVRAVHGNMDPGETRGALPEKTVVEAGGFRIGLIHGWGSPFGLGRKLRKEFADIDCLVYGHSHYPDNRRDGILYFNPGSAAGNLMWTGKTIGMLEIGENGISGRIIGLRDSSRAF
ncbi:MAG: metallophosphoesterase family protein [Syntrophales bacterium]|nr:metallophosphoesterase family protein [Syntrophales bacterium]MDD5232486.1 metallophosphoesterase family protein [Syntrophales bacterium]MDD5531597.1 metallophosphoesterase family protein [Syntrophales bacterium]